MNLSPATINEYRLVWHHLRDYMDDHNLTELSKELANKYFLERFGSNDYVELRMAGQRKAYKMVNRLIEYYHTQQMNFTYPKNTQIHYVFEGAIGQHINTFISALKSDNISSLSINKYERYLSMFNNFLTKSNISTVQQLTPEV